MISHRARSAAIACALAGAALFARPSGAQTSASAPGQELPAVIDFNNRGDYKGDVELDYDAHPGVAVPAGNVTFDDGRRHRRGYVALPNGPGTFTAPDGTTFYDDDFVRGRAEGWGKLVVPRSNAAEGLTFVGLFHDSAPSYGVVTYSDGSSYRGYFSDGCYGTAPAVVPTPPPPPPAGTPLGPDFPNLTPFDPAGTYANRRGQTVNGIWQPTGAAGSCADERVTGARVAYPNGNVYVGDITGKHFTGPGAFYAKADAGHPDDTLLCGTRAADGALEPGRYTLTSGALAAPAGNDPQAVCRAANDPGVTVLTATIPAPPDRSNGTADVVFADGDRETVRVDAAHLQAGEITGVGTYDSHAYPATIEDSFVDGHLGPAAYLTDACGDRFRMRVRRDGPDRDAISNDEAPGAPRYLFHACDRFVPHAGGSVDDRGRPDGPGVKILTGGQTIDGTWRHGRLFGRATIVVDRPYRATIVVSPVGEREGHLYGTATERFSNGDTARGYLNGYALEGPGVYTFASTGCAASGTFGAGKLHGSVRLRCLDGSSYAGTIGPDGSVQ